MTSIVILVFSGLERSANPFAARFRGGLAGRLAGLVGLRLTRFESAVEGRFYTPTPIGIALSVVGVSGASLLALLGEKVPRRPVIRRRCKARSSFLFWLTAGYSIVYQTGVFIHSRDRRSDRKSSLLFHLDFAHDGSRSDSEERGISRQKRRRIAAFANRAAARAFAEAAPHEVVSEFRAHAHPGGNGRAARIHQAPRPARTAPAHHRLNFVLRLRNHREPPCARSPGPKPKSSPNSAGNFSQPSTFNPQPLWTSARAPAALPSHWRQNAHPQKSLRRIFQRMRSRWPGKTQRVTMSPTGLNLCKAMVLPHFIRRGEFHEPQI